MRGGAPGLHRPEFRAGAEKAERASGDSRRRRQEARVMRRLIAVYRSRIGLREHPKY
jgi:hypothetical protein